MSKKVSVILYKKTSCKRFIIQHAKVCFFVTSIQFVACALIENLSNRSSGVQILHDICTGFRCYLYSGWIIKFNNFVKHFVFMAWCLTKWCSVIMNLNHQWSLPYLVLLQGPSECSIVWGLATCDLSLGLLAPHAVWDLVIPGCTFHRQERQNCRRRSVESHTEYYEKSIYHSHINVTILLYL